MISKNSSNAVDSKGEDTIDLSNKRNLQGKASLVLSIVAVSMTLFQLYTAFFGVFTFFGQRGTHILFALTLCFLMCQSRKTDNKKIPFYDWILIGCAIFSYGYMIYYAYPMSSRHALVTPLSPLMMLVGITGIILLIEACRRTMGRAYTLVILGVLAYVAWGNMLPGLLKHRGYSLMWTIDYIFFTADGIFGIPLSVSSTYIFIFICFAHFLKITGAGDYFIDLALSGFGRYRGGPAKSAVFASAMMGTISGSCVANVVATGSMTIPLMKRIGYKPYFAGAVEAVASTGGQLMPPVMGAAAFIMAEVTGIPYSSIALAAIIPALLFYLGVGFQVHFEAVRVGLSCMEKGSIPVFRKIFFRGVYYFLPIIIIFYLLIAGYSPLFAGISAVGSTILVSIISSFINRVNLLSIGKILAVFESTAKGAVEVAVACAGAGIVIGVVSMTGIGMRLCSFIVDISGGHLLIALLLTMCVAIVLGMGLPTVAAYIIQAALLAPVLTKMGVPIMAAHLFCLYYSVLSNITPPVALASYAAASIANADQFKTSIQAVKLGIAAYIVPYMFVYRPALILQGSITEIFFAVITATVCVLCLSAFSIGFLKSKLSTLEKALFGVTIIFQFSANIAWNIISLLLAAIVFVIHLRRTKRDVNLGTRQI